MMDYVVIMRGLREDNDVKQREVAEYLNIDQRVYSRYERGQNAMPVRFIPLLCDYYNVSADYLLGRSKEKTTLALTSPVSWEPQRKTDRKRQLKME